MTDSEKKRAQKYRPSVYKYTKEARAEKDIKKQGYHITDHAVVSFLERIKGINVESEYKNEIMTKERFLEIQMNNRQKDKSQIFQPFHLDPDYLLVIKNNTIITIKPKKKQSNKSS